MKKTHIISSAILVLIVIFLWLLSPVIVKSLLCKHCSNEDLARYGDMFGAFNALFSGLAFVGVMVTLWLQQQELLEQRREISIQRFEATFFNLLSLHNELVGSLRAFGVSGGAVFSKGLEVLKSDNYNAKLRFVFNKDADDKRKFDDFQTTYARFYSEARQSIEQYFTSFAKIVDTLNRSTKLYERKDYFEIVFARLLPDERVFLFYYLILHQTPKFYLINLPFLGLHFQRSILPSDYLHPSHEQLEQFNFGKHTWIELRNAHRLFRNDVPEEERNQGIFTYFEKDEPRK